MTSKVFQTAEEMASYQAGRELAEALTVQTMSSSERYLWLQKNWGRLRAPLQHRKRRLNLTMIGS
jgi:hypothetical protein